MVKSFRRLLILTGDTVGIAIDARDIPTIYRLWVMRRVHTHRIIRHADVSQP